MISVLPQSITREQRGAMAKGTRVDAPFCRCFADDWFAFDFEAAEYKCEVVRRFRIRDDISKCFEMILFPMVVIVEITAPIRDDETLQGVVSRDGTTAPMIFPQIEPAHFGVHLLRGKDRGGLILHESIQLGTMVADNVQNPIGICLVSHGL